MLVPCCQPSVFFCVPSLKASPSVMLHLLYGTALCELREHITVGVWLHNLGVLDGRCQVVIIWQSLPHAQCKRDDMHARHSVRPLHPWHSCWCGCGCIE